MADINRVILSGRLTRDPESRATSGGTSVLSFGIAVNDRRRNQQTGQWEDYANFIDCTMFGNRADSLFHILKKGMLVCLEGRLRWSSWERDGQKRSKIEVIVDEVVLPSRSQGGQGSSYVDAGAVQAQQPVAYAPVQPQGGYAPAPSQGGYPQQVPQQVAQPQQVPVQQPPMDQTYDDEIPF